MTDRKEYMKAYNKANHEKISARQKIYRLNHLDEIKKLQKDYQTSHKDELNENRKRYQRTMKGRFTNLKVQAHNRDLEVNISFEEFQELFTQPCFYCNDMLCQKPEVGCGLDRIDNAQGYIVGNVVPCGHLCNSIRNNFLTPTEAKAAIQAIIKCRTPEFEEDYHLW